MSSRYVRHGKRMAAFCAVILLAMVVVAGILAVLASQPPRSPGEGAHITRIASAPMTEEGSDASHDDSHNAIDWDYWRTLNPDITGWIFIPERGIDLPVVQARQDDPDYYLTHDVYRNLNPWGCPFVDASCDGEDFMGYNTVITGHNMLDGTMFQPLVDYAQDPQLLETRPTVIIMTPNKTLTYRICAATVIDGEDALKQTHFANKASFTAYVAMLMDDALVATSRENGDAAAAESDSADNPFSMGMLTLCTCSYSMHPQNERTLVLAARMP